MELRLLGPFDAVADGDRIFFGRRQERLMLALLALQPGVYHTTERIVDLLWEDRPPPSARGSVQAMVCHLRSALRKGGGNGLRLLSQGRGYLLDVEPQSVDVHKFRSLVSRADAAPLNQRALLLQQALDLRRGPVLADVLDDLERFRLFGGIEELCITAKEEWLESQVMLGHYGGMVAPLTEFIAEHPFRERPVALLMLALCRRGRKPDALSVYTEFVTRLRSEFGLEASGELDQLHIAILRDDPQLLNGGFLAC